MLIIVKISTLLLIFGILIIKKTVLFQSIEKNYDFFNREKILNYLLFHSFKIIVPEVKTKMRLSSCMVVIREKY